MSGRKWTAEQLNAINHRGGNLLVAAGAGSGKTSVLVERVIRLIGAGAAGDGSVGAGTPCKADAAADAGSDYIGLDRLLIVTFTNAAAAEMKERIAAALTERLEEIENRQLETIFIKTTVTSNADESSGESGEDGGNSGDSMDGYGGGGSNGVGGENGYGGDRDESADSSYGGDDSEEDYGGDSGNGSEFYEKRAERLRRQLILLDIASISTIHSFCHSVIKDNIHAVDGLDSGFRLMDDAEASLLRADALDDVLEEKYADETDESFTALVDSYVTGRDDRNIADVILRVFQFARSAPWPDEWLENMTSLFNVQSERDFCVSVWAGLILDRLAEELDSLNAVLRFYGDTIMQCIKNEKSKKEALHAIDELTRIRGLCGQAVNALNSDNAESKSYNEYANVADNVDNSDSAVDADNIKQVKNWRKLRGAIAALGDMACLCPRAARNEGEEIKIGREAVKAAVRQFTGGVVKDYFRLEIDDVRDEFTRSYALLRELSSVVGAFAQRYADLKRGRAVVDFNDLEHFAIKILLKRDAVTGRALPTEAAAAYRKKFAEVLIDEYQDINLVQEYILQAVSGGSDLYGCTGGKKGSVFMVGDVKQSIYRFRQAMPEIFIKKYLTYKTVKNTVDNNTLNLTVGNGEDGIANGNDADGITFGNADDGITVGNDAGDIIGVGVADAQNRQPEGEKILLYKNFRSEPHILTFVNLLFSAVMSKKAGELDYTKEEWLLPGVGAREAYGAVDFVEAHMIDREPPALRTARNAAVNAAATTNGATAEANNAAAAIKTDNAAATANAAMVKTDNAAAATKIKNAVVATKTNNNSASAVAADTAADVASAAAEGADAASPNAGADAGDASDNETPVDAIQEDFDNAVLEARYIARQIKQLMQSAGVPGDGGGTRRLAYRDIAVLMRAVRGTAPAFRDELIRLGVPAYTDSSSAYFETYEISVMLSLLKIIDNPLQDIPLLTVMLSPVFAFTAEEAALIRHAAKRAGAESSQSGGNAKYATNVDDDKDEDSGVDGAPRAGHMPLYDCLTYALNNYNNYNYNNNNNNNNIHGDLTGVNVGVSIGVGVGFGAGFGVDIGKIRAAIQAIGAWRRASVVKPVSELIWKLMHETGFYLHACAMPGGEQRRANLLKFFEYALEYEKISYKGIFSFIRFVDRMISQGEDFAEAKLIGENVDSVRILSIHKSKGLEYPVVFLAGCGKRFNLRDAADQLLLHRELGFGPNYVDLDRRIIDNTIAKKLLAGIIRNEAISEEMRILYVALTRAKSRLFLVGTLIGAERYVDKLQNTMAPYENAGGNRAGLPPEYALKANSYFYWVVSSRFAGNEFPLYIHKADEFAEPAAADGIATDGAATDGVSTVVVASVGASVDGAATDGVSTAGAASVGASAEPAVADGAAAEKMSVEDVVANVKNSVVEITTETVSTSMFMRQFVALK